jgi:hypothetical protein
VVVDDGNVLTARPDAFATAHPHGLPQTLRWLPWIAWFGYRLVDALQRHNDRLASSAFWWLLIVPIGAPIVLAEVLWVMAGFRKREPVSTK